MENDNPKIFVAEQIKAYVKTHLQDRITASELAKVVGYSQYHMARLFKAETRQTPFDYIRGQRLIQSAYALRQNKCQVIDVAFDFVFDSHEGFTRAFSHVFGITPKRYANHKKPEGWLIPYRYLDRHITKTEEADMNENTKVIFTQIVERPARKLILKRSTKATHYFEYCEEVGCGDNNNSKPWEFLCKIKEALNEPVGVWLPDNMRPEGTGVYAHAVEVPLDYAGEIPADFDIIVLEPCKLLVFQGEPYPDENFEEAVLGCMALIEKFNPEVYGYQFAEELAPRMQLEPWGWRGYIEMRPIRETK
jgi:AraC-type DNA-binding domain-containing proteins